MSRRAPLAELSAAERIAKRGELLALVQSQTNGSPLYASQFSTWQLGRVVDRVYRFGVTLADHGDFVLVEPPASGEEVCIYTTRLGADVTVRAAKVRMLT